MPIEVAPGGTVVFVACDRHYTASGLWRPLRACQFRGTCSDSLVTLTFASCEHEDVRPVSGPDV
jgi:hypothetical protein